ncbi:MAG TPA: hypothetical protein VIX82_07270 [Solirubrobacteraceae bacterium]
MSVIVTIRVNGDPRKLEELAAANPDRMRSVSDAGRPHNLDSHEVVLIGDWVGVADALQVGP